MCDRTMRKRGQDNMQKYRGAGAVEKTTACTDSEGIKRPRHTWWQKPDSLTGWRHLSLGKKKSQGWEPSLGALGRDPRSARQTPAVKRRGADNQSGAAAHPQPDKTRQKPSLSGHHISVLRTAVLLKQRWPICTASPRGLYATYAGDQRRPRTWGKVRTRSAAHGQNRKGKEGEPSFLGRWGWSFATGPQDPPGVCHAARATLRAPPATFSTRSRRAVCNTAVQALGSLPTVWTAASPDPPDPHSLSSPAATPKPNTILATRHLPLSTQRKGNLSPHHIPHDSLLESLTLTHLRT